MQSPAGRTVVAGTLRVPLAERNATMPDGTRSVPATFSAANVDALTDSGIIGRITSWTKSVSVVAVVVSAERGWMARSVPALTASYISNSASAAPVRWRCRAAHAAFPRVAPDVNDLPSEDLCKDSRDFVEAQVGRSVQFADALSGPRRVGQPQGGGAADVARGDHWVPLKAGNRQRDSAPVPDRVQLPEQVLKEEARPQVRDVGNRIVEQVFHVVQAVDRPDAGTALRPDRREIDDPCDPIGADGGCRRHAEAILERGKLSEP